MTETKEILKKIAALRLRLDKAQGLLQEAGATAAALTATTPMEKLSRRVQAGSRHDALLDDAMRPMAGEADGETGTLPEKLTSRGSRLVQKTRALLAELRPLADDPALPEDPEDSLAQFHAEATALVETILRTVQAFPPSPGMQLRLCEGLEQVLVGVDDRLSALNVGMARRRIEKERLAAIISLYRHLAEGKKCSPASMNDLAGALWAEALADMPLRWVVGSAQDPIRFAAAQGLNTAQVLARILIADTECARQEPEALVAALVHDIGQMVTPVEVLNHPGTWSDEERRPVERHCLVGEMLTRKLWPAQSWPVLAAGAHHERLDGTGYPAGIMAGQLPSVVRLIGACSAYAAMCSPRPYRPAFEPRTALTNLLQMAEQGVYDRDEAAKLLRLGFYPVGSIVELDDGAVAAVVAAPSPHRAGEGNPAQPVVSMLTDAGRRPLAVPRVFDMGLNQARTILRQLTPIERRQILGTRFPQLH